MLYALTSRSQTQELDFFNNWYDTRHAPSRASCPGVNQVTRYVATDEGQPQWLAMYELDEVTALQTPAYKKARENDGDDEENMFGLLDRRVYKLLTDKKRDDYADYIKSGKPRDMAHVALQPVRDSEVTEKEYNDWYEDEHVPMLMKCSGWLRSSRWQLIDARDPRASMTDGGFTDQRCKYLAVHEWEDNSRVYGSKEHNAAIDTPWRDKIMANIDSTTEERRRFKLWKQF